MLIIGTLINFRRSTWTLGVPPLGLDDDRIIAAFVAVVNAVIDGLSQKSIQPNDGR